jgi:SEC-C motif
MGKRGRNDPCHCGSGKKYKKCCMRQDEEIQLREREEQRNEQDVRYGRIDPFAGDGDRLPDPAKDWDEGLDEDGEEPDDFVDLDDSPDDRVLDTSPLIEKKKSISDEDETIIDSWWDTYRKMSDPDHLHDHIENFMDSHPGLVEDLDLEEEPFFKLEAMYTRQGRPEKYINLLSRLRSEFPDVYLQAGSYFDNSMITWLVVTGQKEKVVEYLAGFRNQPTKNPDNLFELIYFLMSCNCQDILADFLPDIVDEVCTSPMILGGEEILGPMITILMAPFLESGLEKFDPNILAEKIRPFSSIVNPVWLNPQFLKEYFEGILTRQEYWGLDGCSTRKQALERYGRITRNFMGWLGTQTKLDWCAAEYHSGLVFDYLAEVLPKKKRPKEPFPFAEKNMERVVLQLSKDMMWLNSSRLFGMLNGLYRFTMFLEDTLSITPEQALRGRESCTRLFNKIYSDHESQDVKARIWKQFPRED